MSPTTTMTTAAAAARVRVHNPYAAVVCSLGAARTAEQPTERVRGGIRLFPHFVPRGREERTVLLDGPIGTAEQLRQLTCVVVDACASVAAHAEAVKGRGGGAWLNSHVSLQPHALLLKGHKLEHARVVMPCAASAARLRALLLEQ